MRGGDCKTDKMSLRNLFYAGHYKKVLIDAKNQNLQKDSKDGGAAADVFYYRSMIAVGAEEQAIKVCRSLCRCVAVRCSSYVLTGLVCVCGVGRSVSGDSAKREC